MWQTLGTHSFPVSSLRPSTPSVRLTPQRKAPHGVGKGTEHVSVKGLCPFPHFQTPGIGEIKNSDECCVSEPLRNTA